MKNVLIYGDSNSWGYDSARYVPEADAFQRMNENERWPALVRSILGPDYHVIEDALNGRTLVWDDPYMPGRNGLKGLQIALNWRPLRLKRSGRCWIDIIVYNICRTRKGTVSGE